MNWTKLSLILLLVGHRLKYLSFQIYFHLQKQIAFDLARRIKRLRKIQKSCNHKSFILQWMATTVQKFQNSIGCITASCKTKLFLVNYQLFWYSGLNVLCWRKIKYKAFIYSLLENKWYQNLKNISNCFWLIILYFSM